jgi:hypothetical protein
MRVALLIISAIATVICWYFIFRSRDPWYVKIVSTIVAAIPAFGPFFYALVLHKIPPIKPKKDQAKMSHYLGTPYSRNYDPLPEEDDSQQQNKKGPSI